MRISVEQDYLGRWLATDENYDGDPEMNHIVGQGNTNIEAIRDYLEQLEDRTGVNL